MVDWPASEYGPDVMQNYVCEFIEQNRERPFFIY